MNIYGKLDATHHTPGNKWTRTHIMDIHIYIHIHTETKTHTEMYGMSIYDLWG